MSIYTVRFAHLERAPDHKIGDTIRYGDTIGMMGNTGQSTGAHLHIDCVQDLQTLKYNMANLEKDTPQPAPRQLNYFIDRELFGVEPEITTHYADPAYQVKFKKVHFGYDLVPSNRRLTKDNFMIKWNRSMSGRVVQILDDPDGYGNCIYIAFEA